LVAVLGVLVSAAPIAAHYLVHGQLRALFDGYLLSSLGADYLARRAAVGWVHTAREGALATAFFLALPLVLAAWTIGAPRSCAPGERECRWRVEARWLWCWIALALAAACLGGRFYKGYFLAVLPPLCVLAAAPWGLLGRAWHRRPRSIRRWLRVALILPILVLGARAGAQLSKEREDRARAHDRGGRLIARHVKRHTEVGDRVWFWGWHLWDAYALSGRRSGSRIYKSLGLLTLANDDTWRTPSGRLRMDPDSPYPEILLEELARSRPVFVVLGSTVPRAQFTGLREFLRRDYRRDRRARVGRVQFWIRRDR
jgi:hypothetical protein